MATNAGLFPHQPPVDAPDPADSIVTDDAAEMADICGVLASETATRIMSVLANDPTTASTVADRVDTSLQNVNHHLTRLCEADLVRVVDTWYSSRGREMDVYAPVTDRFVLALGGGATEAGSAGAD